MLFDNIDNFFRYAQKNESSIMAYDFIVNYLKKPLPLGHYELDGDNVFANVIEYDTVPAADKDFETHRRYIDFQFLVSGRELIYLERPEALEVSSPYDAENDVEMLKGKSGICGFLLQPNQFAVFYPHEAHKPGCCGKASEKVRKIVIKIAMN